MEDPLLWDRYESLMQASAKCLDSLKDFGFSWQDSTRGYPLRPDAGSKRRSEKNDLNQPAAIVLSSSSSSDSEDDIPLSRRLKRTKAGPNNGEVSIKRQKLESEAKDVPDPKIAAAAEGANERKTNKSPEPSNTPEKKNRSTAAARMQNGTSKAQTIPRSTAKQKAELPFPTTKSRKPSASSKVPKAKPDVIDLEADKDSEIEFTTGASLTPTKRTSLKTLQRTNPALAKAVQNRMRKTEEASSPQAKTAANAAASRARVAQKQSAPQKPSAGSQKVQPNWEAAGQSFWSSVNTIGKPQKHQKESKGKRQPAAHQQPQAGPQKAEEKEEPRPSSNPKGGKRKRAVVPEPNNAQPVSAPEVAAASNKASSQAANPGTEASSLDHSSRQHSSEQGSDSEAAPATDIDRNPPNSRSEPPSEPVDAATVRLENEGQKAADETLQDTQHATESTSPERNAWEDEEWKARRVEIEKQAAEARLQKKKKRAEADLKNRAEVRVNEYRLAEAARETAISERETLRSTYRDGLKLRLKGKKSLRDILLALGCQVDGIDPSSVGRAYKKAVLHFHPDRHVNSPLPAQIYAEEAFKIISEAAKS